MLNMFQSFVFKIAQATHNNFEVGPRKKIWRSLEKLGIEPGAGERYVLRLIYFRALFPHAIFC